MRSRFDQLQLTTDNWSLAFPKHWLECLQQRVRDDFGAFGGGMDAVLLDGSWDVDEILVDHGHEGDVVFGGQVAKDLLEGVDVVCAVVGRESDASEQDLDVGCFEGGQHLVEVAAGLVRRQAAQAVVAAEFDDDDFRVQEQDGTDIGGRVLGGGAAGALVVYPVVVAMGVKVALQGVGVGLAGLQAIASGDAVAKADQNGPVGCPG